MSLRNFSKLCKIACLLTLIGSTVYSNACNLPINQSCETIEKVYHTLNFNSKSDMASRLDTLSANFLDSPYLLGALGEGEHARFDQSPLYRTDAFDCETFVTTIIALALGNNQEIFKQCLKKLRYAKGQISFVNRNHFTSLDWNKNNQQQGFLRDITDSFKDSNNKSVAKIAIAVIDKPSWYQHFNEKGIKLRSANEQEQQKRLKELKIRGNQLAITKDKIPYLPLTALFDNNGNPNQYLFAQIPNASIIEIIRPNWDLRKQIGTHLNVSHLGFAFWKKGELIYRQSSSTQGKVLDVSLISYLKKARSSPTIKGINVQVVLPKVPLSVGCNIEINH